jgi:hypothetical protein
VVGLAWKEVWKLSFILDMVKCDLLERCPSKEIHSYLGTNLTHGLFQRGYNPLAEK